MWYVVVALVVICAILVRKIHLQDEHITRIESEDWSERRQIREDRKVIEAEKKAIKVAKNILAEKTKAYEDLVKVEQDLETILTKKLRKLTHINVDRYWWGYSHSSRFVNLRQLKMDVEKFIETAQPIEECINHIATSFDVLSTKEQIVAISSMYADIMSLKEFVIEEYLINKDIPAYKAAEVVAEVKREKRNLCKQLKIMQYEYELLCKQIPRITEYAEAPEDVIEEMSCVNDEIKNAEYWLSKEEWQKLDYISRLQLALDRYNQRSKKSNRRVGYDYELYCGYNIEHNNLLGCKVDSLAQFGIEEGLNDLGRDIIAQCGDKTFIIQCKKWSKERLIRENTIMQLYGSAAEYCMNKYKEDKQPLKHLGKEVVPVLMTTTELSDVATRFANYLGVQIRHTSFDAKKYPQIKCNIGKDGEKIYHLPFDQQYDTIKIEKEKGECFAFTIKEAEKLGFRHAMRWQGNV